MYTTYTTPVSTGAFQHASLSVQEPTETRRHAQLLDTRTPLHCTTAATRDTTASRGSKAAPSQRPGHATADGTTPRVQVGHQHRHANTSGERNKVAGTPKQYRGHKNRRHVNPAYVIHHTHTHAGQHHLRRRGREAGGQARRVSLIADIAWTQGNAGGGGGGAELFPNLNVCSLPVRARTMGH